MIHRKSAIALGCAAVLYSGQTVALDPAAVPFGSMLVYPALGVGTKYDSNIYRLPSNELSDWALVVAPTIFAEAQKGDDVYSLLYEGEYAVYDKYDNINYDDHLIKAAADWKLGVRSSLGLSVQWRQDHDDPGSTDRSGIPGRLRGVDKWRAPSAEGIYTYGADGAKGRIELGAEYAQKRYFNNEEFTRFSDLDEAGVRGAFYWRLQPKTSAKFEVGYKDFDYLESPLTNGIENTQDSYQTRFLLGLTWEALGKTTGKALFGYNQKRFDSDLREDSDDFSWQVGVEWRPQTYSRLNFDTGQDYIESTGQGDAINRKFVQATWSHYWKPRFVTDLKVRYEDRDYLGDPREDQRWRAGIEATYRMRRWLDITAEYEYWDNSSNQPIEDYTKNVFWLNVDASL